MKLTEISCQALAEAVEQANDTGYSTGDLLEIAEAVQQNSWSKPMSGAEFDAYIQQLAQGQDQVSE